MKNNSLSRSAPMGASASVSALDEGRVEPVVRKALPFDQHGPLADRRQIRQADVGPFRNRPHVDQHRSRVTLQPRPRLFHRNGCDVDLTHVSLHLMTPQCSQDCNRRIPSNTQAKHSSAPSHLREYALPLDICSQQAKIPSKRTLGQLSGLLRSPTASSFLSGSPSLVIEQLGGAGNRRLRHRSAGRRPRFAQQRGKLCPRQAKPGENLKSRANSGVNRAGCRHVEQGESLSDVRC